jgi:hypothetical protein
MTEDYKKITVLYFEKFTPQRRYEDREREVNEVFLGAQME